MTTPIIHPINEKKPELPCWIYLPQNGWTHFTSCAIDAAGFLKIGCAHWSPDSPLPPEVTPEQGNITQCETVYIPGEGKPSHITKGYGPYVKHASPASGPSPAAMEAAKEVERLSERLNSDGGFTGIRAEEAAAIIDRKFPCLADKGTEGKDGVGMIDGKPVRFKQPNLTNEDFGPETH